MPLSREQGGDSHYGIIYGVVDYFDPFSLVEGEVPIKEVPEGYYITQALSDRAVKEINEYAKKDKSIIFLEKDNRQLEGVVVVGYSYGKVSSDAAAARWNYLQLFNSLGNIELGNTQGVAHSPLYTEGDIANTFATSENRIVYRDDPRNADEHLKAAGKPIDYQNRFIAIGNYGSIDDVFNYAQTAVHGTTLTQVIPADLVYIDFNGDGIINGNDKVVVDGLNYPLTTIGFSFGFNWKGLRFSAMLYSPRNVYKLQFDQYLWDFLFFLIAY